MTTTADTPAPLFADGARCLTPGCNWTISAPTPEQRCDLIIDHLATHQLPQ